MHHAHLAVIRRTLAAQLAAAVGDLAAVEGGAPATPGPPAAELETLADELAELAQLARLASHRRAEVEALLADLAAESA